jgi:hypothetical protein
VAAGDEIFLYWDLVGFGGMNCGTCSSLRVWELRSLRVFRIRSFRWDIPAAAARIGWQTLICWQLRGKSRVHSPWSTVEANNTGGIGSAWIARGDRSSVGAFEGRQVGTTRLAVIGPFPLSFSLVDSLAPARSALAGLWLRPDSFRRFPSGSSPSFCGFFYSMSVNMVRRFTVGRLAGTARCHWL